MRSALYTGSIAHQRFVPVNHKFKYPFFMWFINLDELDKLPPLGRWFSTDRFSLSRFHRPDYLGNPEEPLADAVRKRMAELTGRQVEGEICGLMNLRTLGLYFSPVNFYYGFDENHNFTHFLAEVSNIPWNERHQYAHYVGDNNLHPNHPKKFHVSPFNSINQHYTWALEKPGDNIGVQLEVDDERGLIFRARLQLTRYPLNLKTIIRELLKKPAMTLYIIAAIYYQAARLYIKGVPYVPYHKEAP